MTFWKWDWKLKAAYLSTWAFVLINGLWVVSWCLKNTKEPMDIPAANLLAIAVCSYCAGMFYGRFTDPAEKGDFLDSSCQADNQGCS